MTAPVPEERNDALDLTDQPPGEHSDDLPDGDDSPSGADQPEGAAQEENAESSQDQPSQ